MAPKLLDALKAGGAEKRIRAKGPSVVSRLSGGIVSDRSYDRRDLGARRLGLARETCPRRECGSGRVRRRQKVTVHAPLGKGLRNRVRILGVVIGLYSPIFCTAYMAFFVQSPHFTRKISTFSQTLYRSRRIDLGDWSDWRST